MATKGVFLTLHEEFLLKIKQKADERCQTVQEYIYETLRQRIFTPHRKGKLGRPPKVDDPYLEYFSRKR